MRFSTCLLSCLTSVTHWASSAFESPSSDFSRSLRGGVVTGVAAAPSDVPAVVVVDATGDEEVGVCAFDS